jgi:cell division protein ZapA (FtsZ GTPase activity inhibitor)
LEQLVTIEIFGQAYTFKAESESTKAKEVADILVREITKVQSQQPGKVSDLNKLTIMILAALNIANENLELRVGQTELLQGIAQRSQELISALDVAIGSVA